MLKELIASEINIVPRAVYYVLIALLFIGSVILFACYHKKALRYVATLILVEYIFLVLSWTVFYRASSDSIPTFLGYFWAYKEMFNGGWPLVFEIILNMALFIPIGFVLGSQLAGCSTKRQWLIVLLSGMFFSLGIETLQLISKKGFFQIEDIIHNTLGCLMGYLIWQGVAKLRDYLKLHGYRQANIR